MGDGLRKVAKACGGLTAVRHDGLTVHYDADGNNADNGHEWVMFHGHLTCRRCAICRRADGKNKPCRGQVRITLRDAEASDDKA